MVIRLSNFVVPQRTAIEMFGSIIALCGKAVSSHLNDPNLFRDRSLFIAGGGGGGGGEDFRLR